MKAQWKLLGLTVLLFAQMTLGPLALAETAKIGLVRTTRVVPVLGGEGETTNLVVEESPEEQFEQQIVNQPDANEVRLSMSDRLLLAKILFNLIWRGLFLEVDVLAHQLTHTGAGSGNAMKDLSQEPIKGFELDILNFVRNLVDQKQLRPYINQKLIWISKLPIIGAKLNLTEEKRALVVEFTATQLEAAVRVRGMTKDSQKVKYKEWSEIAGIWDNRVSNRILLPVQSVGVSRFDQAVALIDGEASFQKRAELFARATSTIDIMVWAIYDDQTGEWLFQKLKDIQTQRPEVAVRILIDGQTAARPGYHTIADKIKNELHIPVIKWLHPDIQFAGMHRKIMIVDGQHVVTGGMNFGDEYSHLNPDPSSKKWRDTDIYLHGEIARLSQDFYDSIWDNAVKAMNLQYPLSIKKQAQVPSVLLLAQDEKQVTLINQDPTQFVDGSPIFISIMNDIQTAKKRIDIENAYIITIPAFVKALRLAVERGVKVRIFTNSVQSVDEPSIGSAMQITAKHLFEAGAEVYMRKGTTVHSKFLIVDDKISYVMSYNFHPRSERIEGEVAYRFYDTETTAQLETAFEHDVTNPETSFKVTDGNVLNVTKSPQLWLLIRLMYDQL